MSNNSHGLFGVSLPVACHCRLALRKDRSTIGSTTRSAQFVPACHPPMPGYLRTHSCPHSLDTRTPDIETRTAFAGSLRSHRNTCCMSAMYNVGHLDHHASLPQELLQYCPSCSQYQAVQSCFLLHIPARILNRSFRACGHTFGFQVFPDYKRRDFGKR